MNASEFQMHQITWQVFGTLTWRSSRLGSVKSRENQLHEFLKDWTCFRSLSRFHQLPLVVRWERGELGERPHAHFLLSGLIGKFVNIGSCFVGNAKWNAKCGFAKLRLIRSGTGHAAERYVTKIALSTSKADVYEFSKFDTADRLVVNQAAWDMMLHGAGSPSMARLATF